MRWVRGVFETIVIVLITLAGLEAGLRMLPGFLPLGMLRDFQPELKHAIADRLGLPNEARMVEVERDDGGPRLLIPPPRSAKRNVVHPLGDLTAELDENGFCNPPPATQPRRADIVVLGDSFVWCNSWPARLQDLTGRSTYNLGLGGVGPYEYVQLFRRVGTALKPQLVVLNIYEGNDLRDVTRYGEHVEAAKRGTRLYQNAADRNVVVDYGSWLDNPLGRHSYVYNMLVIGGHRAAAALPGSQGKKKSERVEFRYDLVFADGPVPFNVQNADKSEVRSARALKRGEITLTAFDGALQRFVALSREQGFKPVLSYSPSAYTAYAEFVKFSDPELAELMPWYSRTLREGIARKAVELGVPFIDETPALQRAAAERQGRELLYDPVNVHFSPAGNLVVAQTIADGLKRLLQD